MLPMLEFSKLPPRNEEKVRKKRKRTIKTPKYPKVRSIAVAGPQLEREVESEGLEVTFPGAKWVSPQFTENSSSEVARKGKRVLHFEGQNQDFFDPPSRPGQRKGVLSLKNRKKQTQVFMETSCARTNGSCARVRAWGGRRHGSSSQDVSLYPSNPPDQLAPTELLHNHTSSPSSTSISHNIPLSSTFPPSNTSIACHIPPSSTSISDHIPPSSTAIACHSPSLATGLMSHALTSSCATDKVGHAGMEVAAENWELPASPDVHVSSDDSTYLENMDEQCALSASSKVASSNSDQKENSVSSSTAFPPVVPDCQRVGVSQNGSDQPLCISLMGRTTHVQDSYSDNIFDVNPSETVGAFLTEQKECTSSGHGSVGVSSGSCGGSCEGVSTTRRSSSSDDLSDLVASMSMDEGQKTIPTNVCEYTSTSLKAAPCPESNVTTASTVSSFPSLSCRAPTITASLSNGAGRVTSSSVWKMCDLKQFRPPSFSTPVQTTGTSSADSCSECIDSEAQTRPLCSRTCTGEGSFGDSVTRLEAMWVDEHETTVCGSDSTRMVTTPSRGVSTTVPPVSPPKSILKKRSRPCTDCEERTLARGSSKCVTFILPSDSDVDDSVMARETPMQLWQSINSSLPHHKLPTISSDDDSVLAKETPLELWNTPNLAANQRPTCQEAVPFLREDFSILACETPCEDWLTLSVAGGTQADLAGPCDETLCSVLATETPEKQWCTPASSSQRNVRKNVRVVKKNHPVQSHEASSDTWISQNTSQYLKQADLTCTGDGVSVLAKETPCEFWQTLNTTVDLKECTKLHKNSHSNLTEVRSMQRSLNMSSGVTPGEQSCPGDGDYSVTTMGELTQVVDPVHGRRTEDASVCCEQNSVLAAETPMDQWNSFKMNHDGTAEPCGCGCTAYVCNNHKELTGCYDNQRNYCSDIWRTQQDTNPVCILAMETPAHLWASPAVKIVDTTVRHL